MLTFTKAIGVSILCLGGIGCPILGVSYINSQEIFWEHAKDWCLPEELNFGETSEWKKAQDKFSAAELNQNVSEEFKSLKKSLEKISSDEQKSGEHLKNLCTGIYYKVYKSWLFQKQSLLNDLKIFCSLKIGEKLPQNKKFNISDQTDKQEIKNKIDSLQNHEEAAKGELNELLKEIKAKNNSEEDWEKLRDWCKNMYDKPYLGKQSESDVKLAEEYCQKS